MKLIDGELYHVFNRGNNREAIFPQYRNYNYFLYGIEKNIKPYCDILAWCLMPNHFHLLIHANPSSIQIVNDPSFDRQRFSEGLKQLLSSHAKAINVQQDRVGSLFQQRTRAICVRESDEEYARTVFHYIHQNPLKAKLVSRMENWQFSSFHEYLNNSENTLCNKVLAFQLLDIDQGRFYQDSYLIQDLTYHFDEQDREHALSQRTKKRLPVV